jgi:hypothetical protein
MLALALLVLAFPPGAQAKVVAEPATAKVNIEASEFDRRLLLEKLNDRSADRGMRFVQDEKEFSYRINFVTGQGLADPVRASSPSYPKLQRQRIR